MKKLVSSVAALLLALTAIPSAEAAFVIGGENGWQFSTDGFLNLFATYETVSKAPANTAGGMLSSRQGAGGENEQQFHVRTGLLPVGIGFNIKAPTINGTDMSVRLGMYPQIQNSGSSRTDITPNIDFREINFTAKGAYGELLFGRAINLYQAKNILTDMTLFGSGVIGPVNNGPTMGHIGYGYLYPNFGAQIRYTTPDLSGMKVAFSVNDPNQISGDTTASIRNVPRLETEVSYAATIGDMTMQSWISGLYQRATFSQTAFPGTTGKHAQSVGGAGGASVAFSGLELLASGYGGKALGMLGIQDFGALDAVGKERVNYGFLAQATYMLTPKVKLGVNYGQSRQEETANDTLIRVAGGTCQIEKQEAVVGALTYNVNKYWQLIGEYTYAQDSYISAGTQHANVVALGTFFYW